MSKNPLLLIHQTVGKYYKMGIDKETYLIDEKKYDDFVKVVSKKRTVFSLTVFVVVIAVFGFISTQIDHDFPIIFFALIVGLVFFGAFWWGQKFWIKTLLKFRDATIEITATKINLKSSFLDFRSIPLDQIAVIDKTSKGTVIVKGNFWNKIDYYRPKRGGGSLDYQDRIFIPRVTQNYERLIKKIITLANKS